MTLVEDEIELTRSEDVLPIQLQTNRPDDTQYSRGELIIHVDHIDTRILEKLKNNKSVRRKISNSSTLLDHEYRNRIVMFVDLYRLDEEIGRIYYVIDELDKAIHVHRDGEDVAGNMIDELKKHMKADRME